jgi:hypothetical protein
LDQLVWDNPPGRDQLRIRTTSKRLDDGGITAIEQHLDLYPECRLVIIDVLERVRPRGRGTNAYRLDYEALAPLQRMANLRQIAIVVVHHANQRAEVSDVFEKVSGTSGLIGVVDSLLLLQRRRGDDIGTWQCLAAKSKTKPLRSASPTDGGGQHPKGCLQHC